MNLVTDSSFKRYGEVINGFNFELLVDELKADIGTFIPESGNAYIASVEKLEMHDVFNWLKNNIYGGLDIELGICAGHNQKMTAVEYHQGSEVTIALMDCIIQLGHRYDIENQSYSAKKMEKFLLKKGQAVELYSTTLHYSPLEVNDDGYATLVALIKRTNEPTEPVDNPMLLSKNKFMLVHHSRTDKISNGAIAGFKNDEI